MELLPDEVLCHLFDFCQGYEYFLSEVCSKWAQILFGDIDKQREKFVEVCIRDGLEITKKFPSYLFTSKRIELAILNTRIEILELVKDKISRFECSRVAGQAGNIAVIKWLTVNVGRPFNAITIGAARGGQLPTLKWLEKEGFVLVPGVITAAAESGSLETVRWLEERGCPPEPEACDMAARSGRLEVLKWLRQQRCPWGEKTSLEAFRSGNLEMVQWMKEQQCPWHPENCLEAARYGNLEAVKWELQENSGKWNREICKEVAHFGGLEILKWARSQRLEIWNHDDAGGEVFWNFSHSSKYRMIENWEGEILDVAVEGGCLEVVQWAVQGGAILTSKHLTEAAEKGHLKVVQWIINQGQTWHPDTLCSVGDWKVYRWALENGCPKSKIRYRNWTIIHC